MHLTQLILREMDIMLEGGSSVKIILPPLLLERGQL